MRLMDSYGFGIPCVNDHLVELPPWGDRQKREWIRMGVTSVN
jgi:hypothetical protein